MEINEILEVEGAFIVRPQRFDDNRGFFQEFYNKDKYCIKDCKQISYSLSNKGVIRGIHCSPYGKLVQCVSGSVVDYVVDLRMDSKTYLKWKAVELSHDVPLQVYIPPKCGHCFHAKEDNSMVLYLQEGTFNKENEMNVNVFDSKINIDLNVEDYIISEQDKNAPNLKI